VDTCAAEQGRHHARNGRHHFIGPDGTLDLGVECWNIRPGYLRGSVC
jgi:hypothetical protein